MPLAFMELAKCAGISNLRGVEIRGLGFLSSLSISFLHSHAEEAGGLWRLGAMDGNVFNPGQVVLVTKRGRQSLPNGIEHGWKDIIALD